MEAADHARVSIIDGVVRGVRQSQYTRYHVTAFLLTFFSYALFHASRKTFSNVKTSVSMEWTPADLNDSSVLDLKVGFFARGLIIVRFDPEHLHLEAKACLIDILDLCFCIMCTAVVSYRTVYTYIYIYIWCIALAFRTFLVCRFCNWIFYASLTVYVPRSIPIDNSLYRYYSVSVSDLEGAFIIF